MADATPAAQELAEEKGIDLGNVKGSGKDGRVLVEDVEAALEERSEDAEEGKDVTRAEAGDAEAEAAEGRTQDFLSDLADDKREQVGKPAGEVEIGGDYTESSEKSADAYLEHPHVPLEEQSDVEKKDLLAAEDEVQLPGEEPLDPEEASAAVPSSPEESAELAGKAQEEGESEDPDPDLLLSTDSILSRGERERGFYVIPEQVNPSAKLLAEEEAEAAAALDEEAEEASSRAAGSEASASEDREVSDDEPVRAAQQEGVVDTSSGDVAPAGGESLKDKSPAVAEIAGEEANDEDDS